MYRNQMYIFSDSSRMERSLGKPAKTHLSCASWPIRFAVSASIVNPSGCSITKVGNYEESVPSLGGYLGTYFGL